MFKWLVNRIPIIEANRSFWSWAWGLIVGVPGMVWAAMSWFASRTSSLDQYAPFSWAALGLLSALITALAVTGSFAMYASWASHRVSPSSTSMLETVKIYAKGIIPSKSYPEKMPEWHPEGLYVGRTTFDLSSLAEHFFIKITIKGFNATGGTIMMKYEQGAIKLSGTKDGNDYKNVELPPPVLPPKRARLCNVECYKEFVLIIEQRIPSDIANFIFEQINQDERVSFDFKELNIIIYNSKNTSQQSTLPIYRSISLGNPMDNYETFENNKLIINSIAR